MTRHNGRTLLDLQKVRDILAHADDAGVAAAAAAAGVNFSTVYRWRQRRALSGGVWPTDEDVAAWRAADQRAVEHRQAHRRWQLRTLARGGPMTIDPTGTVRRIRALAALGHRYEDIAAHTPYRPQFIGAIAVGRRAGINADTADRIAAVYEQMSGTTGPSKRTRSLARNRGWAPPLAWDDDAIDDPKAKPRGRVQAAAGIDEVAVQRAMHGDVVPLTSAERAEVVRRLTEQRCPEREIARRLRIDPRSVARIKAAA